MKFLSNLDLRQSQILNAVIENKSSEPLAPKAGQIYYNTSDHKFYGYTNNRWTELSHVFSDSAIQATLRELESKISQETERAKAAEKVNSQAIATETSRATAEEKRIAGLVSTEQQRATAAESQLTQKITDGLNLKVDKASIDNTLTQSGEGKVLDARQGKALKTLIDNEVSRATKAETALDSRLDVIEGAGEGSVKKALVDAKAYTDSKTAPKADRSYVDQQLALKANSSSLGTAASKNVGTSSGQIPVLNAHGKLENSVLPALAVNETFTVDSTEAAMQQDVQVGDIVVVNPSPAVIEMIEEYKAYSINKANGFESLDESFDHKTAKLLAEGNMTYICVNSSADEFSEKFRPLQSAADSVSKSEFNKALGEKADKTQVSKDIDAAKLEVSTKASQETKKVESALNEYKSSNNQALAAVTQRVGTVESSKLDASQYKSDKLAMEANINKKANQEDVTRELALKATKVEFEAEKVRVNGVLGKKADTTTVESNIRAAHTDLTQKIAKANQANTELSQKVNTHVSNGDIHVTTHNKAAWDKKTDKFSVKIGDNSKTSFKIAHNLNSEDVVVSIREVSTKQMVYADVVCTDVNNITVSFGKAPTMNEFQVVVIG